MSLNDASQKFAKDFAETFMSDVLSTIHTQAMDEVNNKLKEINIPLLINEQVTDVAIPYFEKKFDRELKDKVSQAVGEQDIAKKLNDHLVNVVTPMLENSVKEKMTAEVAQIISGVNIADIVRGKTQEAVTRMLGEVRFPEMSIPGSAIDTRKLTISGDNIVGGLLKNFQSTGIQDNATNCQVTILDRATVFENRLVAGGLEVAGDATFKGNLIIEGNLPKGTAFVNQLVDLVNEGFTEKYEDGTFDHYATRVLDDIAEKGLDVESVKISGNAIVSNRTLSGEVIHSNLQTVGALKELQVVGESLLDQTLYVSNGRIGVNNMAPEKALDVWDNEVQIVIGKRQQDTGIIGTARNQNLIISANNKDQLLVNTDGSVSIKSLNIGRTNHSSGARMPTDNRPIGQIVWNEQPIIGSPVGWVSLGGARWAGFGIITS